MTSYAGVSMYHADDGQEWAKYIQTKLGSKEYAIHSVLNNINDHPSTHTVSTYVNVVLVSPDFLDLQTWDILKKFDPKSSLAILTGIEFGDLTRACEKKECKEMFDWMIIHELTETDNESVRGLMMTVVAAYEDALRDERSSQRSPPLPRRSMSSVDHGTRTKGAAKHISIDNTSPYDFLPPKRQVNGLQTYVIKDETVFVILHRVAEGKVSLQYGDGRQEKADLSNPAYVYAFRQSPEDQGKPFHITLDGRDIGHCDDIPQTSEIITHTVAPKDLNNTPSGVNDSSAKLPQSHTTISRDISVQTDSNLVGTSVKLKNISEEVEQFHDKSKLDQIHELLKDVMDPEELLCQCLGIRKDTSFLDERMKSMIESVDSLRHNSYPINHEVKEETSSSIWPTLLHFGAQYNLLNFCDAFLSDPLMYGACLIRNKDNQSPEDIARRHGHTELSILLKHFSNYVSGVGREGKYDSGFSSGTPRLSTITLCNRESQPEAPLPRPHNSIIVPVDVSRGYTRMSDARRESSEDLYTFRTTSGRDSSNSRPDSRSSPKLTKQSRIASDDVGYVEEEEDADSETALDESGLSGQSLAEENEGPFGPMYPFNLAMIGTPIGHRVSKGSVSYSEGKSSFYVEEECPELQPMKKDLANFFGADGSPTEKKGILSGFFKKRNRSRSASDPNVKPIQRKSKEKINTRDSKRSSSTSSSSASSTTVQDSKGQEDSQIQLRDADAQKSKTKFKLFMTKAQRRRSVRIKNAMEDKNMSGPSLPPRRKQIDETF